MVNKQQKYRIVADMAGFFCVEESMNGIWYKRFIAGKGQTGLELAEEWLANKKMNKNDLSN